MAKQKQYYVVLQGRQPGLYERWLGEEGAFVQVDGFADAVYKGFYTLQEAAEWLRELRADTLPDLPADLVDLLGLAHDPSHRNNPREQLDAGQILIYTDGGAINNPGRGGYGVVLCHQGHRKELSGGFRRTTNNRMELLACIEGLKALKRRCSVVLYSDSKYVVHGMTKGWAKQWQTRGWKLSTGEDVKNIDLWQQLVALCREHDVQFEWLKGHAGDTENERCDQLARAAALGRDLGIDANYEGENGHARR